MSNLFLVLFIVFIIVMVCKKSERFKNIFRNFLVAFWSYQEMRLMVAACFVIYFASFVFSPPNTSSTTFPSNFRINHHHDFSGNMHAPINIQLSDPGYPIKFEVSEK